MKKYLSLIVALFIMLSSFSYSNYPKPSYRYYIVKEPMVIKNLQVPVGTKIYYFNECSNNCESSKPLREKKIYQIFFPEDEPLIWGGMPVGLMERFFNTDMKGFDVHPELGSLPKAEREKLKSKLMEKSEFIKLWFMWSEKMHVDIKDDNDWSFNPDNMILGGDTSYIDFENWEHFFQYDTVTTDRLMKEHLRKLNEAAKSVK